MSNLIGIPRDKLEAMAFGRMEFAEFSQYMDELQALLAQTAEQHQGEPVALPAMPEMVDRRPGWPEGYLESDNDWCDNNPEAVGWLADNHAAIRAALYTRPAEQPAGTTSDKYKAELYDEVWQLARDMGFGNVTDALMKLEKQPATPVFAQTVLAKLERFQECALDDQDSDIGRDWFDVLVQLGLLNRVQRSPALWEITDEGIAVLEDHAEQPAPVAVVLPDKSVLQDLVSKRYGYQTSQLCMLNGSALDWLWQACLDEVARLNPPQQ